MGFYKKLLNEKSEPGRFAEGPRHPGLILPASAVCEQETREKFLRRRPDEKLSKGTLRTLGTDTAR